MSLFYGKYRSYVSETAGPYLQELYALPYARCFRDFELPSKAEDRMKFFVFYVEGDSSAYLGLN